MRAYNRRLKKSIITVERLRAVKGAKRVSVIIKSELFGGCELQIATKTQNGAIREKIKCIKQQWFL